MSDPTAPDGRPSGLRHILAATVVAGGIGYLIQILVPALAPASYLTFATLWSAIYLVVTCLSGVQQELTRASSADGSGSGFRTWLAFTLLAAVTATGAVALIFGLSGTHLFPADTGLLVGAVAAAAFGYCLVAAVSGAVYGLRDWPAVAGMTIADSLIRAVTITIALLAGGSAVALGWATALPFLLAVIVVWLWVGRRVRRFLSIDVPLRRLIRNSTATVLASLATGMLISGLPLLLNAFAADAGPALLASLILAITLTRAPLVVPLLALQGYLLVSFRHQSTPVAGRVLRWVAVMLTAVVALAALAAFLGPPIMGWLFPSFQALPALDLALIVLSAGLTGAMCITGPAVLAANRHSWYTAGWAISAVMSVVVLVLPVEPHARILAALLIGPLAGALVHVFAVRRQRGSVDGAEVPSTPR